MAAPAWSIYGPAVRGRTCGACKACCVQVPVHMPDGVKPANVRCWHLKAKGPRRPRPCIVWSCRWLMDEGTHELRRPDLAGYTIDPMLDTVLANGQPSEVVQVWVDPARRDAHRDPALRAYLNRIGEVYGMVSIVRWSSTEGMVLIPPSLNRAGKWVEYESNMLSEQEMKAKVAEARA